MPVLLRRKKNKKTPQFCKFEEEKLMKEVIKLAKTLVFSGSFLADK